MFDKWRKLTGDKMEQWDRFVDTHYCDAGDILVAHVSDSACALEGGGYFCDIEEMMEIAYRRIESGQPLDFPEWQ